ncbi:DapH/DapD/GlmU-related protein, partial [Salmonella sp. SAL04284]|uniref:DapH/DapD/GlmU-related protein n=1 Tax=Salmonella sp. SAL04284 TaxID=3159862 RepID=UPI00397BE19E
TAQLDEGVELGPGVVIGANVEIGRGSRIGPNSVVARGVTLGRNCEIGSNVTIGFSYIGDEVLVLPGAQIGQPGFGFASRASGHV